MNLKRNAGHKKSNQKGQGLTEYAVLLSLVAVAAIATTALFGSAIKAKIASIGGAISGETQLKNNAQDVSAAAVTKSLEKARAKTTMKIEDAAIEMDEVSGGASD